ncbi:MAG TPA: hypothetical protein VMY37_33440 [Thermoguttaceae bacterium]|nr:hypothetical protein [Thermoguttaceae bacterium]
MRPRLKGRAYVVRYTDDFVIGFTEDEDARRVMAVLPKRFGKQSRVRETHHIGLGRDARA